MRIDVMNGKLKKKKKKKQGRKENDRKEVSFIFVDHTILFLI